MGTIVTGMPWPMGEHLPPGAFRPHRPQTLEEARQTIGEPIRIYNRKRPHLALEYKMPDALHRAFLEDYLGSVKQQLTVNLFQDESSAK